MVNKEYCMSSFLTFRYVANPEYEFGEGIKHIEVYQPKAKEDCYVCKCADDIENAISDQLQKIDLSSTAILLSGGIDSGILASFMPKGSVAYTACAPTKTASVEIERARYICNKFGLEHRIVDVTWDGYLSCMDDLMTHDGCPVFANEPQVYILAKKILEDGFKTILFGDNADMVFGGYDLLLSREWMFDEWVERFTFLDPSKVLNNPVSVMDIYERYRRGDNEIDYLKFMDEIFSTSSSGAYVNAFDLLGMNYIDPYAYMTMGEPLDLGRIRSGESKYLLRELYRKRILNFPVPEKIAMARAVDIWLAEWTGPKRNEFKLDSFGTLTGEQKFLLYSLDRFLDLMNL